MLIPKEDKQCINMRSEYFDTPFYFETHVYIDLYARSFTVIQLYYMYV